jgi:hypothetical protein
MKTKLSLLPVCLVCAAALDAGADDSNWTSLGDFLGASGTVSASVVDGAGNLYVAGQFGIIGSTFAGYVARWDGNQWSALGTGLDLFVSTLAIANGDLYAGGLFTSAGGAPAAYIARWDGSDWSALGQGLNSWAAGLTMKDGNIYAAGAFTWATNTGGAAVSANRIAVWDGSNWSAPIGGLGNAARTLVWRGDDLIVGGDFTTVTNSGNQTVTVNRLARWSGSQWLPFGSGVNSGLRALEVSGADLYVGGNFTGANNDGVGNVSSRGVAKWSGGLWSGLGRGVNNNVNALALTDTNLYVGGTFTLATNSGGGTVVASRIARWNGITWSGLAGGLNGLVEAVKVSGSNVYVGGLFNIATNSGGVAMTVNRVACWNGTAWSPLGLGLNGTVNALAVSGNDLYAGGLFTFATNSGGVAVTVNRVARWDGTNWSALGAGLSSSVGALLVSGTDLYAGATPGVVRWDGISWAALGGLNGSATELAMSGGKLFACGSFLIATNLAGTVTVNRIAQWDGSNWSALGSGLNNTAWAVAAAGNELYVGGDFNTAGGKLAFYLARATLDTGTVPLLFIHTNGLPGFTNGQFRLAVSGPAGANVVIQASTNFQNWTPIITNSLDGGLLFHSDAESAGHLQRFYRALLE